MTPGDEMTFHRYLWGRNDYPFFYGGEMTPGDEMTILSWGRNDFWGQVGDEMTLVTK